MNPSPGSKGIASAPRLGRDQGRELTTKPLVDCSLPTQDVPRAPVPPGKPDLPEEKGSRYLFIFIYFGKTNFGEHKRRIHNISMQQIQILLFMNKMWWENFVTKNIWYSFHNLWWENFVTKILVFFSHLYFSLASASLYSVKHLEDLQSTRGKVDLKGINMTGSVANCK